MLTFLLAVSDRLYSEQNNDPIKQFETPMLFDEEAKPSVFSIR